jgi:hypothetical protein
MKWCLPHHKFLYLHWVILLGILFVWRPIPAYAQQATNTNSTILATASRFFEFHNGFWLNLHHFLYVQARARLNTPDSRRRAVANARNDLEAISQLPLHQQQAWSAALDYYQQQFASLDLVWDTRIIGITDRLASQESVAALQAAGLDPALVQVLEGAAAVYRSEWWSRHERANRDWVDMINLLLESYASSLAQQIATVYRTTWPSAPLRVDICAYANWAGGYTTTTRARVTVASLDEGNSGTQGLETLFHEALHVLELPFLNALKQETAVQGKTLPPLFAHAILFFTAGEITRRTVPHHVPYAVANGIWTREPWNEYRKILDTHWQPYLDSQSKFEDALQRLVSML